MLSFVRSTVQTAVLLSFALMIIVALASRATQAGGEQAAQAESTPPTVVVAQREARDAVSP